MNDSEEATKPSNEINDLNTWSLEANDTKAVGKIFYTCIRHGSYKGAGLKNSEDGFFVSYFIPSLRTADVFPVVASLPGETKAEKTGCSRRLFHSKPPERCGSVKTKICNLLWIQRYSIFVLSSSSYSLVFDLNDLKRDAIYLSVFSTKVLINN